MVRTLLATNDSARRLAERAPVFTPEVESINNDVWFKLCLLRTKSEGTLTSIRVEILDPESVYFEVDQHGISRSDVAGLRACGFEPVGLGERTARRIHLGEERPAHLRIRVTAHGTRKQEQWTDTYQLVVPPAPAQAMVWST
ncbi:hypothetical protein ACFQZ4_17710 [Catellatospora coxensis]